MSLIILTLSLGATLAISASPSPFDAVTAAQWSSLNASVSGRLNIGVPIAQPCFATYDANSLLKPDTSACDTVQANWADTHYRVNQFGAYEQIFSERLDGQGCDLDALNPSDAVAIDGQICHQGSLPPYYIDVRTPSDVAAGLAFSNKTGVPLIVKNTGHDYIGRSSAPKSLALWTKNLVEQKFDENFVPVGCSKGVGRALSNGAGVTWIDAYKFVDKYNGTVVGGAFQTVGASGGWLLGGGHGFLSGTLGLGTDSALQFKVVTPDGKLRYANKCQNQDIFWALRGGAGSAFGVVLESTIAVHPNYDMKFALVQVQNISVDVQFEVFRIYAQQRVRMGQEGWGGAFLPQYTPGEMFITMANPTLSDAQAAATLKPILDYVAALNGTNGINVLTNGFMPGGSYLFIQENYINTVPVGLGAMIGSRLLPMKAFESDAGIDELIPALKAGLELIGPGVWPPMEILMDAPVLTPDTNRETSVTPVWRTSAFVMVYGVSYSFNATAADEKAEIQKVHDALDIVRKVTPGSAAYVNEADILEPNFQDAFWGTENYARLLKIKKKIDPYNLLTGWNYVGFNKNDPLFDRYNL